VNTDKYEERLRCVGFENLCLFPTQKIEMRPNLAPSFLMIASHCVVAFVDHGAQLLKLRAKFVVVLDHEASSFSEKHLTRFLNCVVECESEPFSKA
jgi:hypothetical protein